MLLFVVRELVWMTSEIGMVITCQVRKRETARVAVAGVGVGVGVGVGMGVWWVVQD